MEQSRRPDPYELALGAVTLATATLVSLFALRNNDVWWMLAVARRIVETHAFIRTDPFSFTTAGAPWVPQAWLSALLFYAIHALGGAGALVVLRAALVVALCGLSMRAATAAGARTWTSAPLVLLVVAVSRTRFMVRGHMIEYVLFAAVLALVALAHRIRPRRLLVAGFLVQVVWTNAHPSFLLGPATVAALALGAWLGQRTGGRFEPVARVPAARLVALAGAMLVACFVNPAPAEFLTKPFDGSHRALLEHFTLEWKSPFDPVMANAAFHPWYEILLALVPLAALLAAARLAPGALVLVVATALGSFQSHRFRVEFAIAAAFFVAVHLARSRIVEQTVARLGTAWRPAMLAVTLALSLSVAWGHVNVSLRTADRWPDRALRFIAREGVAHRPFHPVGVGSYMTWALYGQRRTFIDGRHVSAKVYEDFLRAQARPDEWRRVRRQWKLDAAIVPTLERADAGMRRLLRSLEADSSWQLVHVDDRALVYVDTATVAPDWLARHAYRAYDPTAFAAGGRVRNARLMAITREIKRALAEDSTSARTWIHLVAAHLARGDTRAAADALEHARRLAPDHPSLIELSARIAAGGDTGASREVLERRVREHPDDVRAWRRLAEARSRSGDAAGAAAAWREVTRRAPDDDDAWLARFREHVRTRAWDDALETANEATQRRPEAWVGWYLRAEALMRLGRTEEAIVAGERARSRRPRSAAINMLLAKLYAESHRWAESLERLDVVLEIDPDNEVARRQREWIRSQMNAPPVYAPRP